MKNSVRVRFEFCSVSAPLLNWSCSVLHVFLTDVCDCYVLVADGFFFVFFAFLFWFSLFLTRVVILIFLFPFICYLLYRIRGMI